MCVYVCPPQNKLESLRDNLESGSSRLDKDQLAAVAKLDEVGIQLELIKDLQKQFTTLQSEVCYQGAVPLVSDVWF